MAILREAQSAVLGRLPSRQAEPAAYACSTYSAIGNTKLALQHCERSGVAKLHRAVGLLPQSLSRPRNGPHDARDGARRHGSHLDGELIAAAQEPSDVPPLPPGERPSTLGGRTPFKPYVIQGGRAAARPSPNKG